MKRGYQDSFYTLSERVSDPSSRQEKARKISRALKHHARCSLREATCLDIGCSVGLITSALAPLFKQTIGLEYDEIALRAADADTRRNVKLIQGDAMNLPFGDRTVDVIVCAQVYEHVPRPETLFGEMYRLLRPGGLVFFSGPNWLFPIEPHYFLPFLHWLPRRLADIYLRATGRGNQYYEHSYHWWRLRRLAHKFMIHDITADVLRRKRSLSGDSVLFKLIQRTPTPVWRALIPIMPNFNWVLHKPPTDVREGTRK